MDRWGSCADLLKNRRLLGCCCNLVKKMEFYVLDSQNLLTEVLFDPELPSTLLNLGEVTHFGNHFGNLHVKFKCHLVFKVCHGR